MSVLLLGAGGAGGGAPPSSTPYADEVMADSPVAYWRLAEPSGTTAVDATGNGHDGTYVNTPTLGVASPISDDGDTAVSFASASSEYMEVAYAAAFDLTQLTVEAWANPVDRSTYYFIVSRCSGASQRPFELRINPSGQVEFIGEGAGGHTITSSAIPTGAWTHVAATFDLASTTARLYIDGSEAASDTTFALGSTAGSPRVLIGTRDDGFSTFNGAIDEPAIYNAALSGARIAAHYAAR